MDYDSLFKQALQDLRSRLLREIAGAEPVEVLNCEFPTVDSRKLDLVCRLADGRILHVEVQSKNDPEMAWRMLQYYLLLSSRYRESPVYQVVLYIGRPAMQMPAGIELDRLSFRYRQVDIRSLDPAPLLESAVEAELPLTILCRPQPQAQLVRQLADYWRSLSRSGRENFFERLMIASRLRGVPADEVNRLATEWTHMSEAQAENKLFEIFSRVTDGDIMRAVERDAEARMLLRMVQVRYGAVPDWARERINEATLEQVEALSERFASCDTLEAVFRLEA